MGSLVRWTLWVVLLPGVFSATASANSIPVGTLSFDVLNPQGSSGATLGLDVFNATQPFGGSSITTQLTFSNLSLFVNLSSGTTQNVALSATDNFGDFSSGAAFVAGDVVSATLTGTLGPLGVMFSDGSTANILPTFSTTLTGALGGPLGNGDFALINASTVPEPGSLVLLVVPLVGLLLLGQRRERQAIQP
jgi:hypothetical protein